ncbi:hypothetical protein CK203_019557 [Vitis vinifera]|uniref:Uncharacterized protein n=1 Tax=Vitis vinifera TaxID=29760 RepID=A0A438IYW9_VITVI|nr:hypothetical protein CK203_019557 [Vitis vinifera]
MTLAILALVLAVCVQGSLGGITCENLNKDTCAFAVSSSGKRCVLEKHVRRSGEEAYEVAWDIIGFSAGVWVHPEALLYSVLNGCPNIVDLYFNVAAGEGVFLPKLCEAQRGDARREMAEIRSSGFVAPRPVSGVNPVKHGVAPAVAPASS